MSDQVQVTHRCEKCGEQFIYVHPNCTEHPYPTKADGPRGPICKGKIVPIVEQSDRPGDEAPEHGG